MAYMIMVKTTIILEDRLYQELVEESVKEYGSTRKLSLLINKRLRASKAKTPRRKLTLKVIDLGRRVTEKEIEDAIDEGFAEAVKWSAL
jgi:hypothetical protein